MSVEPQTAGKPYKDEEWLREKYVDEGKSTREIGDIAGCTGSTISRWLRKHDIERREKWKAGVEAAKRANRVERVKMRTFDAENVGAYEYWMTKVWEDGEPTTKSVYVHRLLAVAEHGFDAVGGKDVHHKNAIPWLNTPDNIEVLSRSEHLSEHNSQKNTDRELLVELRRVSRFVDGVPTCQDMRDIGDYAPETYIERFGSWPNAVKQIEGDYE